MVTGAVKNDGTSLGSEGENGSTAICGVRVTNTSGSLARSACDIAACTFVALSERRNIAPNMPGKAVLIAVDTVNDAVAAALETIGTGSVLVAITRWRSISSSSNS